MAEIGPDMAQPKMIQPSSPPKSPVLALILSLLLAGGAGQIYLGSSSGSWASLMPT
jgi:hypothetical protein